MVIFFKKLVDCLDDQAGYAPFFPKRSFPQFFVRCSWKSDVDGHPFLFFGHTFLPLFLFDVLWCHGAIVSMEGRRVKI